MGLVRVLHDEIFLILFLPGNSYGDKYLISSIYYHNAVDKPKFMVRPPDHPWWKTGLPESFLGCPNYFDLLFS